MKYLYTNQKNSSKLVNLFNEKINIYEKCRPNYPKNLVQILKSKSFLKNSDIVVEFGCGTGKLTSLLLKNGNVMHGVEPNNEMFIFLKKKFIEILNFNLYNTNAEKSNLPPNSFNVIISAQAFHLFNAKQAKKEFYRIIKKDGYILLLWYFIDKANPVAEEIRSLFHEYGKIKDSPKRQKINIDILQDLFYPNKVTHQIISQFKKKFSNKNFINSMLSSSYAPIKSNPAYYDYINKAQSIYNKYSTFNNHIEYNFQIHLYTIKIGD